MKNNNTNITPSLGILESFFPKGKIQPTGAFWDAFLKLKDGDRKDAIRMLQAEYFEGNTRIPSHRASLIYTLAHRMPLPTDGLGWVEILASANLAFTLGHLCRAGKVEAIHAIQAEIELNPRHRPNPLLQATNEDFTIIAHLYGIEDDLLLLYHAKDKRVANWLRQRQKSLDAYRSVTQQTS